MTEDLKKTTNKQGTYKPTSKLQRKRRSSIQFFYKSVFGGEFSKITRLKDLESPDFPVDEKDANKIMHIALPIGNNTLMANDVPSFLGTFNENENRSKIAVAGDSLYFFI